MSYKKTIIITGASSGIGAALSTAFAEDGHQLFICARRQDRLAEVAKKSSSIYFSKCDVTSETEVKAFLASVRKRTKAVDALIHCAATMGPVGPLVEADSNDWLSTIQTDLFGAFFFVKHVVPLMEPDRRPRILLLAGGGAFDPMPNASAYGVAKAGIVRLVETLAIELAPRNIAVNALAPGFVKTDIFNTLLEAGHERGGKLYETVVKLLDQWQENDIGRPIECARFLLSDAAAKLTGKTISARLDPWDSAEFLRSVDDIVASKLYATQRDNGEC